MALRMEGVHPFSDIFPLWPWNHLPTRVESELQRDPVTVEALNRIRWEQHLYLATLKGTLPLCRDT